MTTQLLFMLILHVFSGLIGVIFSYATLMELVRHNYSLPYLRRTSVGAVILYLLAWLSGGYYYVTYYGTTVKPVILAGAHPFAHSFFLEVKEHLFLLLPFMAITSATFFWYTNEEGKIDERLRGSLITLVAMTTIIGICIALAGVVTSGAVK